MESSGSTAHKAVPQESGVTEALCMETIKHLIRKARFAKEVAELASSDIRKPMAYVLQGKQSGFLHWCHGRNIAIFKSRV